MLLKKTIVENSGIMNKLEDSFADNNLSLITDLRNEQEDASKNGFLIL